MINAANENQDILGDLLKRPAETQRGYNPGQWQDAANGQANNPVLMHGSGDDVTELREPEPQISRMISLSGDNAKDKPELDRWLADNADVPGDALVAEVQSIKAGAPSFSESDTFNLAVSRVCKEKNIPLTRPAPAPAAMKIPSLSDEVARLEAEARRVRTVVGQDFADIRRALQETTPKPRGRR